MEISGDWRVYVGYVLSFLTLILFYTWKIQKLIILYFRTYNIYFMEKLQPKSGTNIQMDTWIHLFTATMAGLILSGCITPPPRYVPQYRESPYQAPPAKLISKTNTHTGPLWDAICTYIYDNRSQVLALCTWKPSIREKSYTRTIQENTPPQIKVTPPIYSYRTNQFTKQQEQYILVPERTDYRAGSITYKNVICTPVIPFSQTNGVQLPKQEFCN